VCFFLRLAGYLFLGFVFAGYGFFKFCGTFVVSFYCKMHFGLVFVLIYLFWLFFRIYLLVFVFNLLACFAFLQISNETHFGLIVSGLQYLLDFVKLAGIIGLKGFEQRGEFKKVILFR